MQLQVLPGVLYTVPNVAATSTPRCTPTALRRTHSWGTSMRTSWWRSGIIELQKNLKYSRIYFRTRKPCNSRIFFTFYIFHYQIDIFILKNRIVWMLGGRPWLVAERECLLGRTSSRTPWRFSSTGSATPSAPTSSRASVGRWSFVMIVNFFKSLSLFQILRKFKRNTLTIFAPVQYYYQFGKVLF